MIYFFLALVDRSYIEKLWIILDMEIELITVMNKKGHILVLKQTIF